MRINREEGAGLGIILRTTCDGHAICAEAEGAAAASGVVAGSRVLAVAGVPVQGRGEGAVVAVIRDLPPGSPVDLVLAPPLSNWQETLRVPARQQHVAAGTHTGSEMARVQAKRQAELMERDPRQNSDRKLNPFLKAAGGATSGLEFKAASTAFVVHGLYKAVDADMSHDDAQFGGEMARVHAKRVAEQAEQAEQAKLAETQVAWSDSAAGQKHQAELELAERLAKADEKQRKKAAKKAEADRKQAAKKAEAASRPAGPMENEMVRVQAKRLQAEQAKLHEMQVAMQRKQQTEHAELAKLPLAEHAALARASPRWIPDAEASRCMICTSGLETVKNGNSHRIGWTRSTTLLTVHERSFGHRCRYCGWAVCARCSKNKLPLQRWLEFQGDEPIRIHKSMSAEPLRVCDICVEQRVDLLKPKRSVGERIAAGVVGALASADDALDAAIDVPISFVAGVTAVAAGAVTAGAITTVTAGEVNLALAPETVTITIPAGAVGGQQRHNDGSVTTMLLQIQSPSTGLIHQVPVPAGVQAGQQIQVRIPR